MNALILIVISMEKDLEKLKALDITKLDVMDRAELLKEIVIIGSTIKALKEVIGRNRS